jgi:hypothetical protein
MFPMFCCQDRGSERGSDTESELNIAANVQNHVNMAWLGFSDRQTPELGAPEEVAQTNPLVIDPLVIDPLVGSLVVYPGSPAPTRPHPCVVFSTDLLLQCLSHMLNRLIQGASLTKRPDSSNHTKWMQRSAYSMVRCARVRLFIVVPGKGFRIVADGLPVDGMLVDTPQVPLISKVVLITLISLISLISLITLIAPNHPHRLDEEPPAPDRR